MFTRELFDSIFPVRGLDPHKFNLVRRRDELIGALNRILPKYEIANAPRVRAFLANCGIETDYFRTTSEYASGWDYDISVNPKKARTLGNYKKGDGPKFKGGGLSQTTGGFNYEALNPVIGKKLGIDFTKNPELLRTNIDIAVESACIFWDAHNLNQYADRGQFKELSAIVNRGDKDLQPMHWAKRNELYSLCKRRIPADFAFAPTQPPIVTTVIGNSSYTTQEQNTGSNSPSDQSGASTVADDNFNLPDLDFDTAKQRLGDVADVAKRPPVKKLLLVLFTKLCSYVSFVWELGLSGKIALVLGALLVASSIVYTVYYYRVQIKTAASKLKAAVLKALKKKQ